MNPFSDVLRAQITPRNAISWTLLAVAFCIGYMTMHWGISGDEADNLVVGSLISRGYVLYHDIFSHHFPFPYYWVAGIIALFGQSILVTRLSFWVFQILSFAVAMQFSGYKVPLGLAALIWSIVRLPNSGNLILYNGFCATALMVGFSTTFSILTKNDRSKTKLQAAVIGSFSVLSILSDPLSIYAVVVMLIFIFLADFNQGIATVLFLALGLGIYAFYLVVSGTIGDFVRNAVLFNAQVYSKYKYAEPVRLQEMWHFAATGLGIANDAWLDFDLFRPIAGDYSHYDRWFFTGFLYRLATITLSAFLVLKRQWRAALFVYLFVAATLVIHRFGFQGQPFFIISIIILSILITRKWWQDESIKYLGVLQLVITIVISLMAGWLILRTGTYYLENWNQVSLETQFSKHQREADKLKRLTCGQTSVRLAYYPGGIYPYWFTDMEPVSRYIFMWPWVAEEGLHEVIAELDTEGALAIVVRHHGLVWGQYDTREYLRPLNEFLEGNYAKVEEGLYISPELFERCVDQDIIQERGPF